MKKNTLNKKLISNKNAELIIKALIEENHAKGLTDFLNNSTIKYAHPYQGYNSFKQYLDNIIKKTEKNEKTVDILTKNIEHNFFLYIKHQLKSNKTEKTNVDQWKDFLELAVFSNYSSKRINSLIKLASIENKDNFLLATQFILEKENLKTNTNNSIFHYICLFQDFNTMNDDIKAKLSNNALIQNKYSFTPLDMAITACKPDTVKFLLEKIKPSDIKADHFDLLEELVVIGKNQENILLRDFTRNEMEKCLGQYIYPATGIRDGVFFDPKKQYPTQTRYSIENEFGGEKPISRTHHNPLLLSLVYTTGLIKIQNDSRFKNGSNDFTHLIDNQINICKQLIDYYYQNNIIFENNMGENIIQVLANFQTYKKNRKDYEIIIDKILSYDSQHLNHLNNNNENVAFYINNNNCEIAYKIFENDVNLLHKNHKNKTVMDLLNARKTNSKKPWKKALETQYLKQTLEQNSTTSKKQQKRNVL